MLTTRAVRLLRRRFFINGEPAGVLAQQLPAYNVCAPSAGV
ncbi:MAG: hypothetical protein ACI9FG_001038 [Crocinitomicaceae bacterium]|jgi:hypothetical protein